MPKTCRSWTTRAQMLGVAVVAGALVLGAAPSADAAIDNNSKLSVANAYVNTLQAAESVTMRWSGSTRGCRAGAPSRATQTATLDAINFYRALGHLKPVALDAQLSAKAQRAALIMDANSALSHTPSKSWKCWSATGRQAASNSNIALGLSGARAISGYMSDFGNGNEAVGHRRWIMFPATRTMGTGSTGRANALWVVPQTWTRPKGTPTWVSWPTPGYVPTQIEPNGRWSLSATDPRISFSKAVVTVRDASGRRLKVHRHSVHTGYADNTLAWEVSGLKRPVGTRTVSYRVQVTGIHKAGSRTSLTRAYTVRLFDAASVTRVRATARPSLTGLGKVGTTVTAGRGTWSRTPTNYSFRWLRSGVAVPGATGRTYRLTRADHGRSITVQVIARKRGLVNGVSVSRALRVP